MRTVRSWVTLLLIALATLLGGAISGCGDDGKGGGARPKVVASTGVLASIASAIAGDAADVVQLIPDSSDPHTFSPSAKQQRELEAAALVVLNGAGLEAGLDAGGGSAPEFVLSDHVGPLLTYSGEEAPAQSAAPSGAGGQADSRGGDSRGAVDPHVWMSPARVARAVPALTGSLASAIPGRSRDIRARGRRYAAELAALVRSMREALDRVADGKRKLVTLHDSMAYFATEFGFAVVATVFPPGGSEAEVGAAHLAAVEDAVRSSGVGVVFAEYGQNAEALDQVARATGARVERLRVEAPPPGQSYVQMMRSDAQAVAAALR